MATQITQYDSITIKAISFFQHRHDAVADFVHRQHAGLELIGPRLAACLSAQPVLPTQARTSFILRPQHKTSLCEVLVERERVADVILFHQHES